MAASATSAKIIRTGNSLVLFCTIVPTGTYGAPDTLDLSSLGLPTTAVPDFYDITSAKNLPSGYFYIYIPGTTLANGRFAVAQCAGSAAPAADIGAGAYPAGVTGDTIKARFEFINYGS